MSWNAARQQYFQGYVTGGDSYVCLGFNYQKDGYYRWIVKHNGEYPVFDVSFFIIDLLKYKEADLRNHIQRRKVERKIVPYPVITKQSRKQITNSEKLEKSPRASLVHIDARNGSWDQRIELQRVGDEWKSAYIVYDKEEDELLNLRDRFVDDGYPSGEKLIDLWISKLQNDPR